MGIKIYGDLVGFYGNPRFSQGKWGRKTVNEWRFDGILDFLSNGGAIGFS